MDQQKMYLCIDLKTFYASVECVERGLDPFTTNLVVADPSRGSGAICLAITPKMKAQGIHNRCRIFEIPKGVEYLTALPRMNLYIQYSANIYSIYLKYIAKEDIHVYSIDEAFMDVTNYLSLYKMSAKQLAKKIIDDIFNTLGICATVGIGTNLYLTKVALDITAKHADDRMGYLDEESYRKTLWNHRPLTDFWQIGRGISARLEAMGIFDMEGITRTDEQLLYREFGINAEFLIDHAWGRESCTIPQIKAYKSKSNSVSMGQVLFEDYPYDKALIVVKEMVELGCLQLTEQHLVSNSISLGVGYSEDAKKSSGGSVQMSVTTNSFSLILPYFVDLFNKTTSKSHTIRRVGIGFNHVLDEAYEQYDLFTNQEEVEKEKKVQETINSIKKKYGKNSILKGMNMQEGATTRKRNKLVGGHNAD